MLGEIRPPRRVLDYSDAYVPPPHQRVLGERALAGISNLLNLPPAWDGRRALPIADRAAKSVLRATLMVADDSSLTPQYFPLPNGGIQVEWQAAGAGLEIECDPEGDCHVLAVNHSNEVVLEFARPSRDGSDDWARAARFLRDLGDLVRTRSSADDQSV